jgi:hypothetical protein
MGYHYGNLARLSKNLHELACNMTREGTRHQHPEEVERRLDERIKLARELGL